MQSSENILTSVIGHPYPWFALRQHLSSCVLLTGPDSIGKRQLATSLKSHWQVNDQDFVIHDNLFVDDARELISFSQTKPFGPRKFVVVGLDDASDAALNVLLKLCYSLPSDFNIMMFASKPTLETLVSRAHVYAMGYLSDAHVYEILLLQGWAPQKALRASKFAHGQMKNALNFANDDYAKAVATNMIKAFALADENLFRAAIAELNPKSLDLLRVWASEASTGRWHTFDETDNFGVTNAAVIRRLMIELNRDVRPKLLLKTMWNDLVM